jgi:hypothetical protein
MPCHRIARFLPKITRYPVRKTAVATGFVLVPNCFPATTEVSAGVYQRAYLAAKRDVADRRQARMLEAFRWN